MIKNRYRMLFLACFIVGPGCMASTTTTVSLQDLNCQSCGAAVVQKLSQEEGVRGAVFSRKAAEVIVEHESSTWNGEQLAAMVRSFGYGAVTGGGKGSYIPFPDYPEDADVLWLSKKGEAFDESAFAVPGKLTVVDFYAPWCGPCREVDRFLIYHLSLGKEFAVRKVNVADWDSEAAAQMGERLSGLPFVQVYDGNGQLLDSISGLNLESLKKVMGFAGETP